MEIESTDFDGLYVLKPRTHEDARGFFMETYRKNEFDRRIGSGIEFVQDNQSRSVRGVIRGLHFQWAPLLGKLMRVTRGKIFAVAADIRKESATFGKWFGIELSENNKIMLYAPAGFAMGFCALDDINDVQYKYTAFYNAGGEGNIRWDDRSLGIRWPEISAPIISDRDKNAMTLKEWCEMKESGNF